MTDESDRSEIPSYLVLYNEDKNLELDSLVEGLTGLGAAFEGLLHEFDASNHEHLERLEGLAAAVRVHAWMFRNFTRSDLRPPADLREFAAGLSKPHIRAIGDTPTAATH